MDFFSNVWESITGGVSDIANWVTDSIATSLDNFFGKLFYYVIKAMCYVLKVVYDLFEVFVGAQKVSYDGSKRYLLDVFFGNKSINNIYWAMALIGIAFVIAFTIFAVIKKTFDLDGKMPKSHGQILRSSLKSVLVIVLMSAIMSAVLNLSTVLTEQIDYIFRRADTLDQEDEMYFTDEQYSTMARVLNTIGNYSLNSSYNSRYNLNTCYNAIREDLLTLQEQGVFSFCYDESDGTTWQSMLSRIIKARDPRYEIAVDDKNTVGALVDVMDEIRRNKAFYPVDYIKREDVITTQDVPLDRIVFLTGTLDAAKNSVYNEAPSIEDACRAPFMTNAKSIYSFGDVSESFHTGVTGISYLIIGVMAWFTFKNLVLCVFNCIARIFNLLGLYIIAPPMIATAPLDDGAKFKQWISATIVQVFSIFGNLIPMRLILIFVPIVLSDKLRLCAGNTVLDYLAKSLLIIGAIEAAQRFSILFTGLLTGYGANASAGAADMRNMARATVGGMVGAGMVGAKVGGTAAVKVGGAALNGAATVTGLKTVGRGIGSAASKVGGALGGASDYMAEHGGAIGSIFHAIRHRGEGKKDPAASEAEAQKAKALPEKAKRK